MGGPDLSTLSHRHKTLAVNIAYRGIKQPLTLLVDSAGIRVEGEGDCARPNAMTPDGV